MRVAIIGSGPSGVAAASVLVEHDIGVDMFDGGEALGSSASTTAHIIAGKIKKGQHLNRSEMSALRFGQKPGSFNELLYRALAALIFRRLHPRQIEKSIFGSNFAFRGINRGIPLSGAWMPRSLATGGLSNVWGAACYPLRLDDYADWPLIESDLAPWYSRAQVLAGVHGEADSLISVYPYFPPATLCNFAAFDPGSPISGLLSHWRDNHSELARYGLVGGHPRLAVTPPNSTEGGCQRCGFCLFGCPVDAIWHADQALRGIGASGQLTYKRGAFVRHLQRNGEGLWAITGFPDAATTIHGPYDTVLLAAGPLSSLRIAIDTLGLTEHQCRILENDTFVLPFQLNSALASADAGPVQFALSQAVLAIDAGVIGQRTSHLQFYRITEPILGAVGQLLATLPWNMGQAVLKHLRNHLLALIYLHSDDSRRIHVQVDGKAGNLSILRVVADEHDHRTVLHRITSLFQAARSVTGLKPLTAWSRVGPPGFSGHVGGTMPLSTTPSLLQCHGDGQLEGIPGVYVVDMSVFPAMPAQNPTLTAMANAMRCAARLANLHTGGFRR